MPAATSPALLWACLLAGLLWQPVAAAGSLTLSSGLDTDIWRIDISETEDIAIDPLAPDFLPDHSQQIDFGIQTQVQYNSIHIDPGIAIDLEAPAGIALTVVSNGDIVIGGDLNWLGGPLSPISLAGEFSLQGSITATSLTLSAGSIALTDTASLVLSGPDNAERITGSDIVLPVDGNLTLRPVPVPGAFWLLLSGLIPASLACRGPRRSSVSVTAPDRIPTIRRRHQTVA